MVDQFYATQFTTLTQPLPTLSTLPKTFGIDVSRWQGAIDWRAAFNAGVKFAAIRCTVGNYYTDPNFEYNWSEAKAAGILVTPYIVIAPANGSTKLSSRQHWDYFKSVFGERVPDMPIALDCELTRDQSKAYITELIDEVIWSVFYDFGRLPIIYTRQTWWDFNTEPRVVFGQCDLWAARYNELLDGPWGDGKYEFRDWDYWFFWQYSETGKFPPTESTNTDFDYFNGTLEDLLVYCEHGDPLPPPVDPGEFEERLSEVETKVTAILATLTEIKDTLESLIDWVIVTDQRLDDLESGAPPPTDPPPSGDYITVTALENAPAFSYKAPNGNGAPIMIYNIFDILNQAIYLRKAGQTWDIYPGLIEADGGLEWYKIHGLSHPDWPNGLYCRADKVSA